MRKKPFPYAVRGLVLAVALSSSSTVVAGGIPVFDGVAIANMVKEYMLLEAELEEITAQRETMDEMLEKTTGIRGLGNVGANPTTFQDYTPNDVGSLYSGGYEGMGDLITAEEFEGTQEEYQNYIQQRERKANAIAKLSMSKAYSSTQARLSNIETMRGTINSTEDPKAIQELQARIAVEQAAIDNEAAKMALMQQAQVVELQMIEQQRREATRRIFDSEKESMPRF